MIRFSWNRPAERFDRNFATVFSVCNTYSKILNFEIFLRICQLFSSIDFCSTDKEPLLDTFVSIVAYFQIKIYETLHLFYKMNSILNNSFAEFGYELRLERNDTDLIKKIV